MEGGGVSEFLRQLVLVCLVGSNGGCARLRWSDGQLNWRPDEDIAYDKRFSLVGDQATAEGMPEQLPLPRGAYTRTRTRTHTRTHARTTSEALYFWPFFPFFLSFFLSLFLSFYLLAAATAGLPVCVCPPARNLLSVLRSACCRGFWGCG